jgi:uncharacterized repeat protein (TIGR03803 family)
MNSNHRQGRRSDMTAIAVTVVAVLVIFAAAAVPAQAQTPTRLYSFVNGSSDAAFPTGNIVQGRDGNMYGVGAAAGRGANSTGAVYMISPAGAENVFVNFPGTWGNCTSGFTLGRDGKFYGTCAQGNPTNNGSFLYRMTPAGVLTDLHDFATGDFAKYAPIQGVDGNFYGVTSTIIYKMTSAGVVTTIHTFVSPDVQPLSNLFQASDGNLYATITLCALSGNRGCVYKVSTGGVYKNIYGFADPTGSSPCTGMIQGKDGKFYGATDGGRPLNDGNLYKVTTAGVNTGLHDFDSVTDGACNPGADPFYPVVSLLQVTDGSFYGTNYGGANGNGTIYKLTAANVFSAFVFPADNSAGGQPYSTLIQNTNGLVYGTSITGGGNGVGTFFSVATGDAPFVNLEPTEKTGNVGASVGMFGQGFSSASVVKFGGVAATSVTLSGTTYLTAVVPLGAHTGAVTVTTGTTTLTSPQTYKVKPKITSFSPSNGSAGTLVTINGTGLIQATAVKFGTVKATTFTVVSDSQVTAVVPSGLAAGAVTISITTPGGAANSPTKFTVN